MCEERLDDARHRNHAAHNGTESGVILEETGAVLLLRHANGSQLILEVHSWRRATEEGRTVQQLVVLCHAVLVVLTHSAIQRHRLHRNQLQEIRDVVDLYSHNSTQHTTCILVLRIVVQRVRHQRTLSERQRVDHVRTVEGGEIFLTVEVCVLYVTQPTQTDHAKVETVVRQSHMEIALTLRMTQTSETYRIQRKGGSHTTTRLAFSRKRRFIHLEWEVENRRYQNIDRLLGFGILKVQVKS